jgi:uncharacterized protein (TIGR02145 family)
MTDSRIKNCILLFLCLFILVGNARSQFGFLLAADAAYGTVNGNSYYNFSLNGETFAFQDIDNYVNFNNRFSLLHSIDYQTKSNGDQSVHIWASVPLLALFLAKDPTWGMLGLIPDGFSYHFPITPNLDFAPYANGLGFDYVWNNKLGYSDIEYATSFGLKVSRWTSSNWIFQGFLETKKNYSLSNAQWNNWSFEGGLGIAYNFNDNVDVGLLYDRPKMSNFLSPESSQGFLLGTDASVGLIDGERYNNFSLNSEYFTGNRFSILHSLDYQTKSNGEKSVHIWGSFPFLLLSIIEPTWGVLGLVPDGVSYHIPVSSNLDISPYANVLGFDYVWNENQKYLDIQYATSFGLKTSYWTNFNLLVQAFFETKKNYSFENAGWNKWGFEGGLGLAYNIGRVDIDFPEPRIREPRIKVEKIPIESKVENSSMQECITKLDNLKTYQAELEAGNLETAKKVKKELELLSYLSCYSEMNTEQQNRIEYLDKIAKKVIKDNKNLENEKKYSEIGGLRWDNFNSTETEDKDGNELTFAGNIEKWIALCDSNEAAYCYYNFDKNNSKLGLIYNYAAVRVIAPEGKRVPTKNDFDTLLMSLGNSLCSIIVTTSCSSCSKCTELDYNKQLDYNYKPFGWLSVSKSGMVKWVENTMDMYYWTLESEKLNTSTLSGLGLAQFKAASSIKTIKLSEINDIGAKPKNIKLKDFQYVEKYYGTFIRFVKE